MQHKSAIFNLFHVAFNACSNCCTSSWLTWRLFPFKPKRLSELVKKITFLLVCAGSRKWSEMKNTTSIKVQKVPYMLYQLDGLDLKNTFNDASKNTFDTDGDLSLTIVDREITARVSKKQRDAFFHVGLANVGSRRRRHSAFDNFASFNFWKSSDQFGRLCILSFYKNKSTKCGLHYVRPSFWAV